VHYESNSPLAPSSQGCPEPGSWCIAKDSSFTIHSTVDGLGAPSHSSKIWGMGGSTHPRNHPVVEHGIFNHTLLVLFALLGVWFDVKGGSEVL
jgi:hypothetical protein